MRQNANTSPVRLASHPPFEYRWVHATFAPSHVPAALTSTGASNAGGSHAGCTDSASRLAVHRGQLLARRGRVLQAAEAVDHRRGAVLGVDVHTR